MEIYFQEKANDSFCKRLEFAKEVVIEDFLRLNPSVLSFGKSGSPRIEANQLDWFQGMGKGRIDLLLSYDSGFFAIAELKKTHLCYKDFTQLDGYFEQLPKKIKEADVINLLGRETSPSKWFGLLVGTGIDNDLYGILKDKKLKLQMNQKDQYQFGVLVLNRFSLTFEKREKCGVSLISVNPVKLPSLSNRDYTKYTFNNKEYSKNSLVFTLISYLRDKGISADEINNSFCKINSAYKRVLLPVEDSDKYKGWRFDDPIRFNMGDDYLLSFCWSKDDIENAVIPLAKLYGLVISPLQSSVKL